MSALVDIDPITQKTIDLCQTILDQSEVRSAREKIDRFLQNEQARGAYVALQEKGDLLREKQSQGEKLTPAEITGFEVLREELLQNKVAQDFMEAKQAVHRIQATVNDYLSKTFELGRVPESEDFNADECGAGCGCHSHEH